MKFWARGHKGTHSSYPLDCRLGYFWLLLVRKVTLEFQFLQERRDLRNSSRRSRSHQQRDYVASYGKPSSSIDRPLTSVAQQYASPQSL